MMSQRIFFILRQSIVVWLGVVAGLGLISGCGGGGGKSSGGGVTPSGNHYPTASFASPAGTYFKEGENIVFTVSASDTEDGQLTGGSLVWSSKADGTLGTGATLITSALSAGDQEITLTATDSEGAAAIINLPTITVAHTRFIKMGSLTTGVPDASNAFDGDEDIAANIMTPDTEYIHFRAYIGGADTFIVKIKVGASTPGSELAIEGLAADSAWELVGSVALGSSGGTMAVKVDAPQDYKDAEGYINLRARWIGGGSDSVPVYEIWRSDAAYAGLKTSGVNTADLAFDGNQSTSAVITKPWVKDSSDVYLHFKAFAGSDVSNSFTFSVFANNLGKFQSLVFDVENLQTTNWETQDSIVLDVNTARTITIPATADYLDADGYVSLRVRWINSDSVPPSNTVKVHEIQRIDPFFVDSRTSDTVGTPAYAVDDDATTYARIGYFWGEFDKNVYNYDYLSLQSFVGDAAAVGFSIVTGKSQSGTFLVIEGESEPDIWTEIKKISLDTDATTDINLPNTREFINADGYLSLRARWEGSSIYKDAYIYDVQRK